MKEPLSKKERAPDPVGSFFLCCIKEQEAQQKRAGSKGCPVLSSHEAGTSVPADMAGMGEGNKLDLFFFFLSEESK